MDDSVGDGRRANRAVRARLRVGGDAVRKFASLSMRAPRITLASWLLFVALSALAALGLTIDTSTSSFLDVQGPGWATYQRSLERHGGDEFVALVVRAEEPFAPAALETVARLTRELEVVDGVVRVDSLASVALIRAGADGNVELSAALERGVPESEAERTEIRDALRRDLIAPGGLVSSDERAFGINVVLDENVLGERERVVAEIERIAGDDVLVSGVPLFRTRINSDTRRETMQLTPLTVSVMALILIVALRSVVGATLPLTVGGVGTVAAVGALGATGTPLSLSTMILPSVLLALGSAYSMHVVTASSGAGNDTDLRARVRRVVVPVALSGLTTTLGFLAISTTRVAAIRELSLFGAYGVLIVTAASVSLVPAVLAMGARSSAEVPAHRYLRDVVSARLASLCDTRPVGIAIAWTALMVVALIGVRSLGVSTDIIRWYPEDSPLRVEYRAIRDAMAGISPVSVFVEGTGDRPVTEPEVLAAIDALSTALEERDDVGKVLGLGHPMRLMRAALSNGEAELPETRAEAEQYLLLLESEEAIWDVVSRDRKTAKLVLRVDDNASTSILDVASFADAWWAERGPDGFDARVTGLMFEFAREQDAIVRTQLVGLGLALAGVAFVLWVLMGSALGASIALLPNLIPLTAAYGAMGWLGVPLDAATACLGSLALGIAVDDTVHVAASWSRQRRAGAAPALAVRAGLAAVMPALLLSSVAIAIGFGVLGLSDFVLIRNLGLVTTGVVVLCWAADVTLLPVLLRWADRVQPQAGDSA